MMLPNTNVWPPCLSVWNSSMSAIGHVFVAPDGILRICLGGSTCRTWQRAGGYLFCAIKTSQFPLESYIYFIFFFFFLRVRVFVERLTDKYLSISRKAFYKKRRCTCLTRTKSYTVVRENDKLSSHLQYCFLFTTYTGSECFRFSDSFVLSGKPKGALGMQSMHSTLFAFNNANSNQLSASFFSVS